MAASARSVFSICVSFEWSFCVDKSVRARGLGVGQLRVPVRVEAPTRGDATVVPSTAGATELTSCLARTSPAAGDYLRQCRWLALPLAPSLHAEPTSFSVTVRVNLVAERQASPPGPESTHFLFRSYPSSMSKVVEGWERAGDRERHARHRAIWRKTGKRIARWNPRIWSAAMETVLG